MNTESLLSEIDAHVRSKYKVLNISCTLYNNKFLYFDEDGLLLADFSVFQSHQGVRVEEFSYRDKLPGVT
jgi:hypothetical protein